MRDTRRRRWSRQHTGAAATAVLIGAFTLAQAPSAAADPVGGLAELDALLLGCVSPTTAELTTSINAPDAELTIPCDVKIDLAGFDLDVRNIVIEAGRQLTIDDTAGTDGTLTTSSGAVTMPGIQTTGATLVIDAGTVSATGGNNGGAGIGGGVGEAGGTVIINGGSVAAKGWEKNAGIGGGSGGAGGFTTVNAGIVTATGGNDGGAGIGGGTNGAGGLTQIDGGTVTVSGGTFAAGIGGGSNGVGGTTTITGGTVVTEGGVDGAGIGGGPLADGGTTVITAGDVTASGGTFAAGIGGGFSGAGGATTIGGGTVTAHGGDQGAGIGGGRDGAAGTTIITDGAVTTTGGTNGAGIGSGFEGPGGGDIAISGGAVTATGGSNGPGIGSGTSGGVPGPTITIGGGATTATGGTFGAGIGGGFEAPVGPIAISGGSVVAAGGTEAAGIGGGYSGDAGPLNIEGGTVTATGGIDAAGIGGGIDGLGGETVVGATAVVEASGGHSAIGAGTFGTSFGTLHVEGTLRVPTGNLVIPNTDPAAEVTIGETGRLVGSEDQPAVGAALLGTGQIDNGGAITLTADLVLDGGVTVLDHHYGVAFDTDGGTLVDPVTVFAPSFESGARALPADPARDADVFKGWRTEAGGGGDPFFAETVLPGTSPDGTAVEVLTHAWWATSPTLATGVPDDAATITAGESITFTPIVTDEFGDPYPTDPATWTLSDAGGAVTTAVDAGTGEVTMTSTLAGVYEAELIVPTAASDLTGTITLTVVPGATVGLILVASSPTVDQGGSVTIAASGVDQFDNSTGDVTDQTTFTSDVDTDVVSGNEITFPAASAHTITAVHTGGAQATIDIIVTAEPVTPSEDPTERGSDGADGPLPTTGTELFVGAFGAALLIAAGLILHAARRPRRR
ncbi:beta strand repeat-containing protein [Ruania halotolerans]|uniref:beta strand repeat-containing protein n=1 Tax=Ruania halotolerans TaxID=2897773 RepID=UPI001E380703|nr:hypothetical protein [Ruania halotolerans]UFU06780.1 hypothetical protein LQF10_01310 [Ruania halotolerans]